MPLKLLPFDEECRELLDALPKQISRHCFRSAFHHLEMAHSIVEIDPAMAAFRVLTAEEEAASGLMHCLQERAYINSDQLNPRNHLHKNAITPFFGILGLAFSEILKGNDAKPALHIQEVNGERRLTALLKMQIEGEEQWLYPIPPLNFSVTSDSKPLSYRKHIDKYVLLREAKDINSHLKEQANFRNKLLYAGPQGYPETIDMVPNFFQTRTVRILALLRAYLLIKPYAERLSFVQDALDAYLAMIGRLSGQNLHEEI